ncbi:hypothetical protein BH11PSE11_BH11PSE11_06250 [soil metagenome]
MKKTTGRFALALASILLFSSCAGTSPVSVTSSASTTDTVLVRDGKLTDEGELVRDRGLELYQLHRDADVYATWLPLAEQGHGESMFNLGSLLREGTGIAADLREAHEWTRKAALAGYPSAYCRLGADYDAGELFAKNAQEALRLWRKGATLGESDCALYAGQYLVFGMGVPRDAKAGIAFLEQAAKAERADLRAQAILGRIYLDGDPVAQDYVKARYWLELAAAQESDEAQHNLALIHDNGYGVPVDKAKAISLYQRAARQKNSSSLNNLGYAYRHGEGVSKDLALAASYFEQSHALGNFDGTINLADMLFKGWGQPADPAKAVALYKAAADAGIAVAQCRYARALRHGDGVTRNVAEAERQQAKARAAGSKENCEGRLADFLR